MRGSPISEDRGVAIVLGRATSASGRWRARAGYAILGMAVLTSPIVLPFALALLVVVLRGTPLGAAILDRLHLIYIGSTVYCLAALTMACLVMQAAPDDD
jgi:hypothetical protein